MLFIHNIYSFKHRFINQIGSIDLIRNQSIILFSSYKKPIVLSKISTSIEPISFRSDQWT